MDSDEGKLFIGGIAWDTDEDRLRDHFSQYGEVNQAVIMRDKTTGKPRGFGFVVFSDPSILDTVLRDPHNIDGRTVDAKKALSREEQHNSRPANYNAGRNFGGAGNYRTKKIFVGGLPATLTEDEFRQYFENFGHVTDVVIMMDQNTNRPRGFGFITFDTEDAVDRVLLKTFHELSNKLVEVKRALPKDASPGVGGRGGGYQGHGSSSVNASTFNSRMDGHRFLQAQTPGGGYPPYSSYGAQSYGYGAANNSAGYGGYGSYGVGGYGSAGTGYSGPAGAYGNPSTPNTGYVSGPPGAAKSSWGSLTPGYGANPGYGATIPWSAPGSGGASSYGNSSGYGTVGGHAGTAPNSNAGGGPSGAEQQGTGGGYMGNAYGGSNASSGYSNATWRSDS